MCGLAGWFATRSSGSDPAGVLAKMISQIRHRGPDSSGGYLAGNAALGAVRLAIRDPEHGDQPFFDPTGRYRIAFNGEIYNDAELRDRLMDKGHTFRTRCDTEVALAAWMEWGVDAFSLFEGGFALAIMDRKDSRLTLARDRFGKRPLHWAPFDGGWLFASEAKSFLGYPGWSFHWSEESLAGLIRFWATPPDKTVFDGVRQVTPGTCLQFDASGVSVRQFGSMDFASSGERPNNYDSAVRETRNLVSQSVKRRLRSDRKLAVTLSGGLDSSIVLHDALDAGAKPSVFALGFKDHAFDESEAQDSVAEAFGVEIHRLVVSDHDIADSLPRAVSQAESPLIRTAGVPMMLLAESMRSQDVAVSLSGEGADELFLGYDLFKDVMMNTGELAPDTSIYDQTPLPQNARLLSSYLSQSGAPIPDEFTTHRTRLTNSAFSLRAFAIEASPWNDWLRWYQSHETDHEDPVDRARQLEMRSLMTGHLLSLQGDRMAMTHGIEHRTPFLDQTLAEWAHRLPSDFCLGQDGVEKRILREAFAKSLPESVLNRRKRPYLSPVAAALRSSPDYLEALRSESEMRNHPILEASFCEKLVTRLLADPARKVSEREERTLLLAVSTLLLERGLMKRSVDSSSFEMKIEIDPNCS